MSGELKPHVLSTPVLDGGVLPPRRRRWTIAGKIIGYIFSVAFWVSLGLSVNQAKGAGLNFSLGPIFVIVAIILAITVHELGHLAAGRAVGFHFSFISIGPFILSLEHGALKFRFRRDMDAAGYAGMHADGVRRLRYRSLIYLAAGPTANLFSVPIAILLVDYAIPGLRGTWLPLLGTQFVFFSCLFGVLSFVPYGLTAPSDGSSISMLLWSRERARRRIGNMAIGSQMHKGVRPRCWRKTWLQAACSVHDGSLEEFSSNYLAYIAANDRKDESAAAGYLEKCLESSWFCRPSVRDVVAQESAVFTAWFRGDAALADKWVSQIEKPKLILPLLQIRLAVALAAVRRDFDAALFHLQEGLEFIHKLPVTPERDRLTEGWLEWQSEIQERQRKGAEKLVQRTSGAEARTWNQSL